MPRSSEQLRAQDCWNRLVSRFGDDPSQWRARGGAKKHLAALKKTAARIYASGPAMALTFLVSRKGAEPKDAANDIAYLVMRRLPPQAAGNIDDAAHRLIQTVIGGDMHGYALIADEALANIAWLARFLEGAGVEPDEDAAAGEEGY